MRLSSTNTMVVRRCAHPVLVSVTRKRFFIYVSVRKTQVRSRFYSPTLPVLWSKDVLSPDDTVPKVPRKFEKKKKNSHSARTAGAWKSDTNLP